MTNCINSLKQWTGSSRVDIVYDSVVDEFTATGLFEKIQFRSDIAVIGFTTDGDVFGGFYTTHVTRQNEAFYDDDFFAFSFESHGRCETPQRFSIAEKVFDNYCDSFVYFSMKDAERSFVSFIAVPGWFDLGNEKSKVFCCNISDGFEGAENTTLTGNQFPESFQCLRIIAVQLSGTLF